jgi:hypothetical protein
MGMEDVNCGVWRTAHIMQNEEMRSLPQTLQTVEPVTFPPQVLALAWNRIVRDEPMQPNAESFPKY